MLTEQDLSPSQARAINRLYGFDHTILIAHTGAGKTVICLTAIQELIANKHLTCVIVVAPARVVERKVWSLEAAKWQHLAGMVVRELEGFPGARRKLLELPSDVLVISLPNLTWLLAQNHPANGVVVDELSKASGKQSLSLRLKPLKTKIWWRVGMTATPVSHNFEKLYGMLRIIDSGSSLGTNKERFLNEYFYPDYMGYSWTLKDNGAERIMEKVGGLIHAIDDTKEADLPAIHQHEIRFDMPADTRILYNKMRRDMVIEDVEAVNAAVKYGKLRQLSSGFVYTGSSDKQSKLLDTERYHTAAAWVRALDGRKAVIFYEFLAQRAQLEHLDVCRTIDEFIDGKAQVLIAQIKSLSHGIDGLQHVCADVLFYHPMWSRDATEQATGRIWRQGQQQEVHITTLVCNDSLDDIVVERVQSRGEFMKLFLKHIKAGTPAEEL